MTSDAMMRGPRCRHCPRDEATCAREGGCCPECTHWAAYDDHGNPKSEAVNPPVHSRPQVRPIARLNSAPNGVTMTHTSVTPTEAATSMAGVTTGTSTKPVAQSWPHVPRDHKPSRCTSCGRRTSWRADGTRIRHRVEADNPKRTRARLSSTYPSR